MELDKRALLKNKENTKHVPDRKERSLGNSVPSSVPPSGAPKWTISKEWLKGELMD